MKRITKFIAILLLISLFVSSFAVLSFGAESSSEEASTFKVYYNRTFDEGWGVDNGISLAANTQLYDIDYEELADYTYNYFIRMELLQYTTGDNNGYLHFSGNTAVKSGGTVFEYDIKADCYTNLGEGYFMTPGDSSSRTVQSFFKIKENNYYIQNGYGVYDNKESFKIGSISDDWVHIANVYNFDQDKVKCTCGAEYKLSESNGGCGTPGCKSTTYNHGIFIRTYFSYSETFDSSSAVDAYTHKNDLDLNNTYYYDSFRYLKSYKEYSSINTFRMGLIGGESGLEGQGFLLDNMKLYSDTDPKDEKGNSVYMDVRDDVTLENYGYGSYVNVNKAPTVVILGKDGASEVAKDESIIMKVGSDFMLAGGKRCEIFKNAKSGKAYGAPVKRDGMVYVPFEPILEATGYPVFAHDDGMQYDISTERGTSIITLYRDVAIVGGERIALNGAPFMARDPDNNDNVYPVIALDDVPTIFSGYYVTYDEMGLIGISKEGELFNRADDLNEMVEIMKKFIFDDLSAEEIYQRIEENTDGFTHPYLVADKEQFDFLYDVYTAHLARANGEDHDESLIDDRLFSMMRTYVKKADGYMDKYTKLPLASQAANDSFREYAYDRDPDKYQLLAFEITNPFYGIKEGVLYTDGAEYDYAGAPDENGNYMGKKGSHYNDGYDWAGDQSFEIEDYADVVMDLAVAYNVTRNVEYANLAYDITISLCDDENWHHWLHKHFLATGGALTSLGFAFDWLYNIWYELQDYRGEEYSLGYIAQQIYRKGIYYGYDITRYSKLNNVATKDYDGKSTDAEGYYTVWNWSRSEINWNGVCSSGIIIAAMAIVGESDRLQGVDYTKDGKDSQNRVMWCMENNLRNLCIYGMGQYAPDGSYIEGVGYWSYATNNIAQLMWAVKTAVGDDLGLYETWGFDKTFYFAVQSEYSKYENNKAWYSIWMYHDSAGGVADTSMFFFAAEMLDDQGLAAIRKEQLSNGKGVYWADILGYKPEYMSLSLEDATLDLDYRLESCEGVVCRSSWEVGHTYAGIMGNANNCGEHGQMDSGMFTYVDDGFAWFSDIGSDNYYVYGFFTYGIRQHYYRNSAEGHNQIILTSQQQLMPFGQNYTGAGVVTDYVSEDAGMYAIIDNTTAYSPFATFAKRGMLFTNNRRTVVIQDEISFGGAETAYWIGHTMASSIVLSDDGRTAYLSEIVGGVRQYVRVSIVSPDTKLKFEIMTCAIKSDGSDRLLSETHLPSYSTDRGGQKEKSRTNIKRLVIKAGSTLGLNLAVVIEDVPMQDSSMPVEYDFKYMNTWHEDGIQEEYNGKNSSSSTGAENENVITNAKIGDIITYGNQAKKLLENGYALSTRLADFFVALVKANCAVNTYRPESFKAIEAMWQAYENYLLTVEYYRAYSKGVNDNCTVSSHLAYKMTGI